MDSLCKYLSVWVSPSLTSTVMFRVNTFLTELAYIKRFRRPVTPPELANFCYYYINFCTYYFFVLIYKSQKISDSLQKSIAF